MLSFRLSPFIVYLLLPLSFLGQEVEKNDSSDVLAEVLNTQRLMPAPATSFRPGHIKPREIEDYLNRDEDGFTIQLPQKGLTPSPTVYKNMLFVGGGFGSKEFYAFHATTGEKIWAIELDDDGPSAAVIHEDLLIFNTESCTIFACNAFTGELVWSYYLGDPLMSTPTIANGLVFTAYPASRGQLLLPSNNNYQNYLQQQQSQYPDPIALQEKKHASTDTQKDHIWGTHILIAMNARDGKIVWQKWIDGDVMSAPVAEGDELFVSTFPGTFYKFALATGEILAAQASRATSAPVIVGDQVYMSQRSENEGEAVAEAISVMQRSAPQQQRKYAKRSAPYLDARIQSQSSFKSLAADYDAGNGFVSGAPANSGWQAASSNIGQSNVASLQAFQGSRILHIDGKNYNTMGDELICSDPQSGKVIWKHLIDGDLHSIGGFLATPPISVDGKVIIASIDGDIIIYHAESGDELSRYSTGEQIRYQPVISNGWIYVSTMSGKIIGIRTGNPSLTGWSTWGANAAHTNQIE